jgi:hypothetical protein
MIFPFAKRLMQPKTTSESAGKAPIGIEKAIEAYYKYRGFEKTTYVQKGN